MALKKAIIIKKSWHARDYHQREHWHQLTSVFAMHIKVIDQTFICFLPFELAALQCLLPAVHHEHAWPHASVEEWYENDVEKFKRHWRLVKRCRMPITQRLDLAQPARTSHMTSGSLRKTDENNFLFRWISLKIQCYFFLLPFPA